MTAPAGPLRPSPDEARRLRALEHRIADLEDQYAELLAANSDLIDQLDGCRRTVAEQQDEASRNRPRRNPLPHPRPVIRDVPTGGAL